VTDLDQDSFSVAEQGAGGGGAGRCKFELPLKISAAEDGGAKDDELASLFKRFGLPLFKARLAEFCSELKSYEG
jgi:hypothetical protein